MNIPPRLPNANPQIQEEVEQQRNYAFELGNKLIINEVNERNTYVLHREVGVINVLQTFADIQQEYRKLYTDLDDDCVLMKMVNHNLALRSSMLGWRSKQIVEILQSPKIEMQNAQPLMPDSNKGIVKRI